MAVLLELNDVVNNVIQSCGIQTETGIESCVHDVLSNPLLNENITSGQSDTENIVTSVHDTNTT